MSCTPQAAAFELLRQLSEHKVTTVKSALTLFTIAGAPGITAAEIDQVMGTDEARSYCLALQKKNLIMKSKKGIPGKRTRTEFRVSETGKAAIWGADQS